MPILPLRAAREERGWSRVHVAELLAVSTRTITRWEQGEARPYPYYREQLAVLFDRNLQQLGLLPDDQSTERPLVVPSAPMLSADDTPPFTDPLIPFTLGHASRLLGRDALLAEIKTRLFADATLEFTALNGLPGIGKTALAVALTLDIQVQRHFPDGILWAALGHHPNVLALLARWGNVLGIQPSEVEDVQQERA